VCLDAVNLSGMTLKSWANAHGVDGRSLHAWKMNLARAASVGEHPRAARLVELVPHAQPAAVARYRILCGELAVEVNDDFDDGTLRRLLAVVAGC
jgi:hypothetical protein